MDTKSHWESVYQSKAPETVSWYQPHSERSLALVRRVAPDRQAAILDVGGGASTLVDDLLSDGYTELAVLDLSGAALDVARERLGSGADGVRWLEANVLDVDLPQAGLDVWHDRAVFHFLTAAEDQQRYVEQVCHALKPGGHVVIAAFAEDGPTRCSGLDVQRYSPEGFQAVFGERFQLEDSSREVHVTPAGGEQAFTYCVFRLNAAVAAGG
ncbi:class I SAM-dependent methyltransferase [Aquisalimonas sp.]|uniref:class I SAM-dependent methyltransferase n=1 Tax=Aquisalimonas sp. TaxID=1872621 RepID=UPI0025C33A33|nr:class I SAM-dependent methyltransferase [Aquisalimonas sp.]